MIILQTKDHYKIARYLSEDVGLFSSDIKRLAFITGSIFPDINLLSYFKGKGSLGHSYSKREKEINKAIEYFKDNRTITAYFRLGVALHYIQDSFTFPHNEHAGISAFSHLSYESKLHNLLCGYLYSQSDVHRNLNCSVIYAIKMLHEKYCCAKSCAHKDLAYIIVLSRAVISGLAQKNDVLPIIQYAD